LFSEDRQFAFNEEHLCEINALYSSSLLVFSLSLYESVSPTAADVKPKKKNLG
jgi:hypothetical protein